MFENLRLLIKLDLMFVKNTKQLILTLLLIIVVKLICNNLNFSCFFIPTMSINIQLPKIKKIVLNLLK